MVSSLGLGSGLPLADLVNQLVSAEGTTESQRILREDTRLQTEKQAIEAFKGAITDLQGLITSNILSVDKFQLRTASSSDKSVVTISASTTAQTGNHTIQVNNLAQAHKVSTAAFTSKTDTVGTGTITISYGTDSGPFVQNSDKSVDTITINSSNNSLEGIRDAINAADGNVQASIVNDGTGFRLVIASTDTGAENSLKITVNDDDGNDTNTSGLSQLAYDPDAGVGAGKNLTETVAAEDATIIFDGITINKANNVITDVIEGATLTLLSEDVGVTKNLSVSIDKTSIRNNVESFLNSFRNNYNAVVTSLTSYDPETETSGPLLGDFTVRTLDNRMRQILSSPVNGLIGPFRSLSDLGITTKADGTLTMDTAKFNAAMDNDLDEIARVFTAFAKPTDSNVEFVSSTDATQVGSYLLNITQMATQGDLVGGAVANTTITAGVNDTLEITVDGTNVVVTLTDGTYTASSLVSMVQAQINGHQTLRDAGVSVNVAESGGVLTLTSTSYGSTSAVDITGGNGKTDLVGAAPTLTTGLDVAGTIDGQAATGVGQQLTGGGDVAGLVLKITGGTTGARGTVDYTRGIAEQLDDLIADALDADGPIKSRIDALTEDIASLDDDREDLTNHLIAFEQNLINQFTALDGLLSQLTSTGSFLQQQFQILNSIASNRGG